MKDEIIRSAKGAIGSLINTINASGKKQVISAVYEEELQKMSRVTGLTEAACKRLCSHTADRFGITPEFYFAYHLYSVSSVEQPQWLKTAKELEKSRQFLETAQKKSAVQRTAFVCGISTEAAKAMISEAEQQGISPEEFADERYYQLPNDTWAALHESLGKTETVRRVRHKERLIARIAAAAGCDRQEARKMIERASDCFDLLPEAVLAYQLFETESDDYLRRCRDAFAEEARKAISAFERDQGLFEKLSLCTGWSEGQSEQTMRDAKERAGIGYQEYLARKMYLLSPEEQDHLHIEIREERGRMAAEETESCLRAIMSYRGCGRDEAEAELKDAKKRLGISPRNYRRYRFFAIPEESQKQRYEQLKAQLKQRSARKEDTDENSIVYFHDILEQSGLAAEKVRGMLHEADIVSGASWKDFRTFQLWEVPKEEWRGYYTKGMREALMETFDDTYTRDLCANKEWAMSILDKWMGRKWAVSTELSEEEFCRCFSGVEKILYKPSSNGNTGSGIRVFDMAAGLDVVYGYLHHLPRGIVEEFIVQHAVMDRMYPGAVNTVRIVTVGGEAQGKQLAPEICYTALRIGSGGATVDNFSMGGLVAAADVETGVVMTDAVDSAGNRFSEHPDTGEPIRGFEIPCFLEAKEMVLEAAKGLNGHIGWDVAISNNGPVLIEINTGPGNRILQAPFIPERKGMAYVMDRYLKMTEFFEDHKETETYVFEPVPFHEFDKSKYYTDILGGTRDDYLKEQYYLLSLDQLKNLMCDGDIAGIVDEITDKYKASKGDVYARICDARTYYNLSPEVFGQYELYACPKAGRYRQAARELRKQKRRQANRATTSDVEE